MVFERADEIIALSAKDSECFVNMLLKPPEPSSALKVAAKRYQDFIDDKHRE